MTTVVLVASPAASATVTNVSLRPDRYWTATSVVLRSGDLLTISATGQMHFGPAPIDRVAPPGLGRKCPSPVPGLHWPAPDLTCWSLVARIGASAPFEVGARTTLQVREGGALSLGINDDNLRDDLGSWTAVVTIEPPPSNATTTPAPVATKGTSNSSSFLVIVALAIVVALVAGLAVVAARRRRSPTTPIPLSAVADAVPVEPRPIVSPPESPASDFDRAKGNIFEVDFADGDSLRVGYSYFPEGTLVQCRVTHNSTTAAMGEFVTHGGGSAPRYATVPLGTSVTSTLEGVKVRFNWTIGDLLEYSVTREPCS